MILKRNNAPIFRIFDVRSLGRSSGEIGVSKMSHSSHRQKISDFWRSRATHKGKTGAEIKKTPEKSEAFFTPLCLHTDVFVWGV